MIFTKNMTKEGIEKKLEEIALAPIKEEEFQDNPDLFFYNLCVKAFNLGVQLSADNAELHHDYYDEYENRRKFEQFREFWPTRSDMDGCDYGVDVYSVDKESILKLKL